MDIISLLTALFFITLGFLVKSFPNLKAGYNTMSPDRKKDVDIKGLSTFIRNALIITGFIIIGGYYLFNWVELTNLAN